MSIGKINMIYYNEKEVRLDKMREALLREPNYEKHDRMAREINALEATEPVYKPAYFLRWGKQTREIMGSEGLKRDILEVPTVICVDASTKQIYQFEIKDVQIDIVDYLQLNDLSQFEL